MKRGGSVYILTNERITVLYTGVTSDLAARIEQHKSKKYPDSFTSRYNIHKLVYYHSFGSIQEAIAEEKRIKGMSRKKKFELVASLNPDWLDLSENLFE